MLTNEQKSKILFLWLDDKEFHCVNAQRRGVPIGKVYRDMPKWLKALRRVLIILDLFSISPWLEDWKRELGNYETVIIHASKITSPVVKYINKRFPNIRIIVWYWNPVDKCEKLEKYPESICERWCFDESDSKRYNIPHNTQYYFSDITLPQIPISNDVYFLGGDKGRLKKLLGIESDMIKLGLNVNFYITRAGKSSDPTYEYRNRITYDQNLNEISKSKSILDFVSEGQAGLTLRPLEALFFRKKLITNDKGLINRDFFSISNVYILDNDTRNLKSFIEEPYLDVDKDLILKYDFDSWLSRFYK